MKVETTWKQVLVLNGKNTIYENRRFWKTFQNYTSSGSSLHFLKIYLCGKSVKFCICNFTIILIYCTQASFFKHTRALFYQNQFLVVKDYQNRFRNPMTIFLSRSEHSKQSKWGMLIWLIVIVTHKKRF